MNPSPIARLLGSTKALVMLATMAGSFALVALGKLTWEQAEKFLMITVPAWLLAVGLEDAGKHLGAGKSDNIARAVADAVKKSLPPPPDKDEAGK